MDASVTSSGLRAAETARPSRAKGTLALSGLLVLVTAGLGISLSLGRGRGTSAELSPPVPAALAPASTAAVAPSSGAEPARVRIVVSAKPRTSELVIDGNKVEGGVYEAEVAPTLEPHQVRVSAPGFVTSERSVVFDRNVSFEVALVPAVARGGAPASTARPKSAASAPATTQPRVGARQIDDKDPYERKVVP